jgi:prolyl-tRNA editing enzyme YbaK/EbsC (Cys-tRNA(Pro) deacylase)
MRAGRMSGPLRPSCKNDAMAEFVLGKLIGGPVARRLDLVAPPTRRALESLGLVDEVAVVEIDPRVSDTAATQEAFDLEPQMLANCVVVGGKREGVERIAACMVLSDTRADVNNTVKRLLDVRKASFLPMERAVELTGMEYGGITPIGLPPEWPVLVDGRVPQVDVVVIGSGVRQSKILCPGALLARLPSARVVEGLAGCRRLPPGACSSRARAAGGRSAEGPVRPRGRCGRGPVRPRGPCGRGARAAGGSCGEAARQL